MHVELADQVVTMGWNECTRNAELGSIKYVRSVMFEGICSCEKGMLPNSSSYVMMFVVMHGAETG